MARKRGSGSGAGGRNVAVRSMYARKHLTGHSSSISENDGKKKVRGPPERCVFVSDCSWKRMPSGSCCINRQSSA